MKLLRTELAGESVLLDADRGLIWGETLFVADTHFGKDATFRAHGHWVPPGALTETLHRLDALLARHRLQRLVILGDLFHSAAGEETVPDLRNWRDRQPHLDVLAVPGNHDRTALHRWPAMGVDLVTPGHAFGPWTLWHEPPQASSGHALCGHLHPVARLRGPARQSLRLPCFHLQAEKTILPAFGAFTGGHAVRPRPGEQIVLVGDGEIFQLFA